MINAYKQGKDLYAVVASKVYNNNYEDNLEFNPITNKIQPDGKQRRTSVKSVLLGKYNILLTLNIMPLYTVMCIENGVNHDYKWVCLFIINKC